MPDISTNFTAQKRNLIITSVISLVLIVLMEVKLFLPNKQAPTVNPITQEENKGPKYAPGEVIVKFKSGGLNLKSISGQALSNKNSQFLSNIKDSSLPPSLKSFKKKYSQVKIEKVFKDYTDAQTQLSNFKKKFTNELATGKRKINEQALLKNDLAGIYKIKFNQTKPVDQAILELRNNPEIAYAEPNYIYEVYSVPNDPLYLDHYPDNITNRDPSWDPPYDYQWNLKKINAEGAWDIPLSNQTTVAVIDTGIDYTHEEFGNCTLIMVNNNQCPKIVPGYNFVTQTNNPIDDNGHGTHVAGTIASLTNNNTGIASLDGNNNLKIMPLKGLDKNGSGYIDVLVNALIYAAQNGAKVINMSYGSSDTYFPENQLEKEALDTAFNLGVTLVAAAGNSNSEVANGFWPANNNKVISVAATDQNDSRSSYSNYGKISVAAPGGDTTHNILSLNAHNPSTPSSFLNLGKTPISGGYLRLSGTSMASPHVAGLAGLILAKNPNLAPFEVKSILELTADSFGNPGMNKDYGFGRINTFKAISYRDSPPVAEIFSPVRKERITGTYQIIGTATAANFSSYNLSVGLGENPTSWSKQGIVQTTNNQVANGLLGTIDTSYYTGQIIIRLQTIVSSGQTKETYVFVSALKDIALTPNVQINNQVKFSVMPATAINSNNVYTTWADGHDGTEKIYFSKSTDGGLTFSANQLISSSPDTDSYHNPDIIIVDTNIYIIYQALNEKIIIRRSTDLGQSFNNRMVLSIPSMTKPNSSGRFMEIHTSKSPDNHFLYLTWQASQLGDSPVKYYVYFSRFNLLTNSFEETKVIRTIARSYEDFLPQPTIINDNNGQIYILWTEEKQNGWARPFLVTSSDSGITFSQPKTILDSSDYYSVRYPYLYYDQNFNTIYLTFAAVVAVKPPEFRRRDVFYSKSTDYGQIFSPAQNITKGSLKNQFRSAYYQSPIITNKSGEVFISYNDINVCSTYLWTVKTTPVCLMPPHTGLDTSLKTSLANDQTDNIFITYDSQYSIYGRETNLPAVTITPTTIPTPTPTPLPSISIPLNSGWNMVSFPLEATVENQSPNIFFKTLIAEKSLESVLTYYDNNWTVFHTDIPLPLNTLKSIQPGVGYWVKVNKDTTFSYSGVDSNLAQIPLITGWNLIGPPNNYSVSLPDLVNSLGNKIESVWYFKNGQWQKYLPSAPSDTNNLSLLEGTKAYWIKATQATNFLFYPTSNLDKKTLSPKSNKQINLSPPPMPK